MKCQLIKRIADMEVSRNQKIVGAMLNFQWCDVCSSPEPGAVEANCNKRCGKKLVTSCIPLMRDFGDKQETLDELNHNLSQMSEKDQQFTEYRKAKENFVELQDKEKEIMTKMEKYNKLDDGSIKKK
jgi:hypothetical protein